MAKIVANKIIDGVEMRLCSACGKWKPATTLYFLRAHVTPLKRQCKTCTRARDRERKAKKVAPRKRAPEPQPQPTTVDEAFALMLSVPFIGERYPRSASMTLKG